MKSFFASMPSIKYRNKNSDDNYHDNDTKANNNDVKNHHETNDKR